MRQLLLLNFLLLTLALVSTPASAKSAEANPPNGVANDLILVGLLDGPLSGTPKFAEFYVVNDIPDLSIYGLGSANNGGGTDGQEWTFPAEPASAGQTIYVANDTAAFRQFMGYGATYEDGGASCNFNGDDAFEVFENGVVVDIYGLVDVDGTDESWEYTDGWVKRVNGTGPDGSAFVEASWTGSAINNFDDQTTNDTSPEPYPTDPYDPGNGGGNDNAMAIKGLIHGSADVKVAEFEVLVDIPDLSIYGLGCANNGGGSDGQEWTFPAGSASAGDRIYVARDLAAFQAFFGFDADYEDPDGNALNFNGDDAFELFENGVAIDEYGDVEIDGTGEEWEYTDGWAHRVDGTGPDGDYVAENWTSSALGNYDGVTTNAEAPEPYPVAGTGTTNSLILVGLIYASADVKVTEYYVAKDIADLSAYGVGCANNGGGSDGEEWTFPAESATAGDRIYVARDSQAFVDFFGFMPTYLDTAGDAHNFNGDDGFELFENGTTIDIYGDTLLDGTGEDWEYVDTWAQRKCATGPDGSDFVIQNWTVATLGNYDGVATNAEAPEPYPVDAYQIEPCGGGDDDRMDIVITEIMYNSPGTDLEFVEFYNNTDSAYQLAGYYVGDAVDFTFPEYTLEPGEFVMISDDSATFETFYGVPAFQWLSGSLNNSGEDLTLLDADSALVDSVAFTDIAPWPSTPDGRGPSLVLCDVNSDNNDGANWQRSVTSTGQLVDGREVFANPGVLDACVAEPIIAIQAAQAIVGEADGMIDVLFYMDNPNENETSFDVVLAGGTAGDDDIDFTPTTLTFPPNSTEDQMISIGIIDDGEQEEEEYFTIRMTNATNGALVTNDTMRITIVDNDAPITNSLALIGIVHGPNSGVPKATQFLAVNDIENLSLYGLGCANNGGGSDGQEYTFPAVSVEAGTCFWVTNDAPGFVDFFGFEADFVDDGAANNFNGDDAYEVFESGEVIDVFGEIDADGTGTAWEYSLGWVHRIMGTGPDGSTFVLENWDISDIEIFVGAATNADAAMPYPVDDCGTSSTQNVDFSADINMYPNPSSGEVHFSSGLDIDEIQIRTLLGQSMGTIVNPGFNGSIDMTNYPSQVYLVSFIVDDKAWTAKLVLQK